MPDALAACNGMCPPYFTLAFCSASPRFTRLPWLAALQLRGSLKELLYSNTAGQSAEDRWGLQLPLRGGQPAGRAARPACPSLQDKKLLGRAAGRVCSGT